MTPNDMKFYMIFDKIGGPREGACLVVANTVRQAKKLGYRTIQDWFDTEYIDIGVNLIKEYTESLKKDINMEKFNNRMPQVIDNPIVCPRCECWGTGKIIDGECEECIKDKE